MSILTKNLPANTLNRWSLARSISHMKSVRDLDKRSLFLTIHLKNKRDFEKFVMAFYKNVRAYLVSVNKVQGIPCLNRAPGLFACLDNGGSRQGLVTNSHPHIHAVLIFGKTFNDVVVQQIIQDLEAELLSNKYVDTSYKSPVKITRITNRPGQDSTQEQMENLLSYVRKESLEDERIENSMALPYDEIVSEGDNETLMNALFDRTSDILSGFADERQSHKFFSTNVHRQTKRRTQKSMAFCKAPVSMVNR